MDAVQGKDGTDIQRFWTKVRQFRSEKGKKKNETTTAGMGQGIHKVSTLD